MRGGPAAGMTDGRHDALLEWQQNAAEALERSQRTRDINNTFHNAASTIRPVTPEAQTLSTGLSASDEDLRNASSVQLSPRSLVSRDRRQGLIFQDTFDHDHLGPPLSNTRRSRTRTLEETATNPAPKNRLRIGSLNQSQKVRNALDYLEYTGTSSTSEARSASMSNSAAMAYPSLAPAKATAQLQKSISTNKKHPSKRLIKRSSSRPSSPKTLSPRPSVNCLPFPVSTDDPTKILGLMGSLNGVIKGPVEYQLSRLQSWALGICYIDEGKGSLMCEGMDHGPFHTTLVSDLRGCRIRSLLPTSRQAKSLEISSLGFEIIIVPSLMADFDKWLAALLYWQQIRPIMSPSNLRNPEPLFGEIEQSRTRSNSGNIQARDASIIKIGNILLWDDGPPSSASPTARRTTARDPAPRRSWHRVSCTLQDDGEFKLLTENDNTILAVVHLKHLSRSAIQPLEKSVLNEEFCIAIYPHYNSSSSILTILRPIYIALDTRVLFEVWFVLLRAFCAPEIYGPYQEIPSGNDRVLSRTSDEYTDSTKDMFRIEKSLSVRIIEAKIRKMNPRPPDDSAHSRRTPKPEQDASIADYFSEVLLDGEIRARTVVRPQTRNPFWREECHFQDLPSSLTKISIILKRMDSSEPSASQDQPYEMPCGSVVISLDKLDKNAENERWWPILDDQDETIGELFLKIRHDELVVLMSRDYQPVLELLDRFSNGLTVQIAQSLPMQLKRLAEIFVNIFQVPGKSSEWLTVLCEEEIDGIGKETSVSRMRFTNRVASNDSLEVANDRELIVRDMGKSLTGEANLLFRGNSLLTQALDFHMKRVGKEYLEDVLSESINDIESTNPDCEVDPSRLSAGEDIERNWEQLRGLTTAVWDAIRASVSNCPSEIRILLKHVRSCADSRYGDFLRTVPYTSVSGFLFLRFFCPAILNPKLFGLLKDHPRPKAQRTLTLIAKSLQVLANLSTFGQKEAWMEPMNRFLTGHRQAVKDFIDDLCSLPNERGPNFAVPASYSTPITILARLPQLSKEGFPSLPYLIDHPKNFAALVKLWLDFTPADASGLEGDLLEFHKLCIALQRRTDECLSKAAEHHEPFADPLSQWEHVSSSLSGVTANVDRTYARESPSPSPSPTSAYHHGQQHETRSSTTLTHFMNSSSSLNGQRTAPGSSGSDTASGKERERKDKQSFWESAFGKDSKYHRPYESEGPGSGAVSPPSRGPSRNGKQRSFLSGLRRKGKGLGEPELPIEERDLTEENYGPQWHGGMI